MLSEATLATDKAARYMTQLAKHWSHKFEVELTPTSARIHLPMGPCAMQADATTLTVRLETASETMDRMEEVVARHLARFAFREPDLALDWRRSEA